MDYQRTQIAAGILIKPDTKAVFIAQRSATAHKGGLWEFPGGKLEKDESAEKALIRELEEEIGITPTKIEHFMSFSHDYADRLLDFHFYLVFDYLGEPFGKEGQECQWIKLSELPSFHFAEANERVQQTLLTRYLP